MSGTQKGLFVLIIFVAFLLRFYQLGSVPAGLHADEASQGFNAFSLLKTGKDMYGKSFPILFRASGSYQPPVYTYLSIFPTIIFGNSIFTIRTVSALSGVLLVILTYFFVIRLFAKYRKEFVSLGLISSAIVAISPWSIHFSRLAVEANLGVFVFVSGVYLLISSLSRISLFPLACMVLGLSTHVYYSERVIAVLLLSFFVFYFRKKLLAFKKITILGLVIFAVTLLPHLFILTTGALTKRLTQVSYLGTIAQEKVGALEKAAEVGRHFINHYLIYVSPKNLFFDPGSILGRTTPNLGVFYPWMLAPFLIGIGYLFKNRKNNFVKIVGVLFLLAPIPAGLTDDLFYPLRTLDYLWIIALVVSFGCWRLLVGIKRRKMSLYIALVVVAFSIAIFWLSYFVIFKYELAIGYGEPYVKLMSVLENYKDKKIWVDFSGRAWGAGIRMTYLKSVDPEFVQTNLKSQLKASYYSQDVNAQEIFVVDNVTFEPLVWKRVCGKDLIIVGDSLSVDSRYISEHKLKMEFTVPNYLGEPILFGYSTDRLCN